MIVGIVSLALVYMGTSIKRGMQSMVKVTADQIGNQQNSDQDFNDAQQGYMQESNTQMTENSANLMTDKYYVTNSDFNESTYTTSNTITNGGFSPSN